MLAWLKKHFIPHEENNHRPHILRGCNIRNIVVAIIFLEIITFLLPTLTHLNTTGNMAAVLPAVLADLTNIERQSQNLVALTVNPILDKAAEMKAKDMASKSYFAHTSPEGKTPWYWLEKVGYQYQYAGENLAINFSDSKDVANAWMASPTHKANIVKGNYTEIGTGIATGIYEGHNTIFVAQVYANPLPSNITQTLETPSQDGKKVASIIEEEPASILGAAIENIPAKPITQPTFWQKLLASPRNTTNVFLYIIFGIITLALLLYIIFIKMKNHHIDLITNGLIVLAIIGAVFMANYYLSHRNMVITQSLDYSNENQ
ncbi:MAG: CAP domain-containing protein [bacterium]